MSEKQPVLFIQKFDWENARKCNRVLRDSVEQQTVLEYGRYKHTDQMELVDGKEWTVPNFNFPLIFKITEEKSGEQKCVCCCCTHIFIGLAMNRICREQNKKRMNTEYFLAAVKTKTKRTLRCDLSDCVCVCTVLYLVGQHRRDQSAMGKANFDAS